MSIREEKIIAVLGESAREFLNLAKIYRADKINHSRCIAFKDEYTYIFCPTVWRLKGLWIVDYCIIGPWFKELGDLVYEAKMRIK